MFRPLTLAATALLASSIAVARYTEEDEYEGLLKKRAPITPVMSGQNFPDPALLRMADGWHAFATNTIINGSWVHVPMAKSPDFQTWTYLTGVDAMPTLAAWVDLNSPRVWAPDVVQLDDGSFIMYYTAAYKEATNLHCVSYATSNTLLGPYVDSLKEPWICPTAIGGAIDPSGYTNSDGTRWVVYKIDGNAIGHGGSCGNTVEPIVSTPIMLQQVNAADGYSKIGEPIQLITNGPADGPVVEAPSLSYLGGKYVLFFSSNCFATTLYDVSYATASHIKGPYTKYGPLFVTGTDGMTSPGGLDIAVNGNHAIWHGSVNHSSSLHECIARHHAHGEEHGADECNRAGSTGRAAYTAILSLTGNVVTASTLS